MAAKLENRTSKGNSRFYKLLEPGQIGNVRTKNRLFKTAAGSTLGDGSGMVTQKHRAYYRALARGGLGLIIVEHCSVEPEVINISTGGGTFLHLDDDKLAELRNKKVGFVFQAFNLLPRTTVLDNVKLPLTYADEKIDIDQKAKAVLKSVGLEHRLGHYTNQISGGEKQRVAIARALVNQPAVIFADEPTGNLDSRSGIQIMQILQMLNDRGNTIILVTHETYTSEHAKRIIQIRDGQITSDTPVLKRRIASGETVLK